MTQISDRRRCWEILAVIITGLGKFIFVDILPLKFWYISIAILSWSVYVVTQGQKEKNLYQYWGFTFNNFKKVFLLILPFAMILIIAFWIYGKYTNSLIVNWHITFIFILYPIWGIVQQFLMVGLVARNLKDMQSLKLSTTIIILITSILFCIVHFPSIPLVIATLIMGMIYAHLFLRFNTIVPLGLYHGWMGGLFYFFALGRDPWNEVFNF